MKHALLKPLDMQSEVALSIEKLRMAMFDGISEEDVRDIVKRFVKRAKEGDKGSIEFVLKYLAGGAPQSSQYVQNNFVVKRPAKGTDAKPGSIEKIEVLRRRAANGKTLARSGDAGWEGATDEHG